METVILNTPEVRSFPIKVNNFGHDYCVVYLHGLFESCTHPYVLRLIDDLSKNKIDNCSFDFFAHGARQHEEKIIDLTLRKYVEEIKMVIHTLKNYGYRKFVLIGASFGGLLTHILKSIKLDCIGLIYFFSFFDLKSPGLFEYNKVQKCIKDNQPMFVQSQSGARKEYLSVEFLKELDYYFQQNRDDLEKEKVNIPKLIINGTSDTVVNYKPAIKYAKKFKDAKLLIYDMQHGGRDKDTNKYSEENATLLNNKMIEFIKIVTAPMDYFKRKG